MKQINSVNQNIKTRRTTIVHELMVAGVLMFSVSGPAMAQLNDNASGSPSVTVTGTQTNTGLNVGGNSIVNDNGILAIGNNASAGSLTIWHCWR